MGRNRAIGAPNVVSPQTVSFTTFFPVDVYPISAPNGTPVVVTLDPDAVQGDQVLLQDAAGNAGTQPIVIEASAGQTIVGVGSSTMIAVAYGQATLTYSADLSGWLLQSTSTGQGSGVLDLAWVPVVAAQSPYTATTGRKFLVNSTAGAVRINLPALTDNSIVIVSDADGQSAEHPITVYAPAGATIEDPSNPGNYATFGTIANQGLVCWWQYVAALNQLVLIVP